MPHPQFVTDVSDLNLYSPSPQKDNHLTVLKLEKAPPEPQKTLNNWSTQIFFFQICPNKDKLYKSFQVGLGDTQGFFSLYEKGQFALDKTKEKQNIFSQLSIAGVFLSAKTTLWRWPTKMLCNCIYSGSLIEIKICFSRETCVQETFIVRQIQESYLRAVCSSFLWVHRTWMQFSQGKCLYMGYLGFISDWILYCSYMI